MLLDGFDNTEQLIGRIAEGDEKAFALFYRHWYPQLLPFLQRHVVERSEADEVLQQVFLRVWLHRDQLPAIRSMKAWLSKITAREYLRALQQKLTLRKQFPLEEIGEYTEVPGTASSHQLSLKELNHAIRSGVERLSPQRREVFTLSRSQSLTVQEIADRLQLSPQTVKNTLSAALKEVREFLQERGYLLSPGYVFWLCYLFFKKY